MEQDRKDALSLNKISKDRFKEQIERGFDILTNDPATQSQTMQNFHRPQGLWSKAIKTSNKGISHNLLIYWYRIHEQSRVAEHRRGIAEKGKSEGRRDQLKSYSATKAESKRDGDCGSGRGPLGYRDWLQLKEESKSHEEQPA
jgi:hypothetical protein